MKACTNCKGNLADFVTVCPYCGVAQPVPLSPMAQPGWDLPPQNSNKAIASLVCGILLLFFPASIAAVILGHLALSDIKKSNGRLSGQGLAIAGLVMGYLGVGFTALFTIAAVIGVRSALRHNVPANEQAAIATMRTYNQALTAYKMQCPQQGYPSGLPRLGPGGGDCSHANLLNARLAMPRPALLGYQFVYTPGIQGSERVTVFALVARPVQPGLTGKRYFYLDEDGVLRQAPSQIVGPNSDPVDQPGGSDGFDGDTDQPQQNKAKE